MSAQEVRVEAIRATNLRRAARRQIEHQWRLGPVVDNCCGDLMGDSGDSCRLSSEEEGLLQRHMDFYRALETGQRKPKTPAQEHFVLVTLGRVAAVTDHERAYAKHMRLRAQQREVERSKSEQELVDGPTVEWFTREDWHKLRHGYRRDRAG